MLNFCKSRARYDLKGKLIGFGDIQIFRLGHATSERANSFSITYDEYFVVVVYPPFTIVVIYGDFP